jgi:hypothetical protein
MCDGRQSSWGMNGLEAGADKTFQVTTHDLTMNTSQSVSQCSSATNRFVQAFCDHDDNLDPIHLMGWYLSRLDLNCSGHPHI